MSNEFPPYFVVIESGRSPQDVTRFLRDPPSLEAIAEWVQKRLLARVPHDPDSNHAACRRLASILRERIDASTIERAIRAFGSPEQKARARASARTSARAGALIGTPGNTVAKGSSPPGWRSQITTDSLSADSTT